MSDLTGDHQPLDHVKLCVLGASECGKTSLLNALGAISQHVSLSSEGEDSERRRDWRKRPASTRGIEISTLRLSTSREMFHVWDFAGQAEHFITHNFFLTTENTAYMLVLDLSKPLTTLHNDLMWWLNLLHMHNLGQAPFYEERQATDIALMQPSIQTRTRQISRVGTSINSAPTTGFRARMYSASGTLGYLKPPNRLKAFRLSPPTSPIAARRNSPSPNSPPSSSSSSAVSFLSSYTPGSVVSSPTPTPISSSYALTPVPIVIVGSVRNELSESERARLVANMEELIQKASKTFQEYLDLIPRLFLLNPFKPQATEVKQIKEQLSLMRTAIMEVNSLSLFPPPLPPLSFLQKQ